MTNQELIDKVTGLEEKLDLIISLLEETKPKKGSRWKDQPMPESFMVWITEKRPDLNPDEIYREFSDYWISASGKSAIKINWLSAFKNWCRKIPLQEKKTATWETNSNALLLKARELGLNARPGEGWDDLRRRVQEAIR